MPLWIGEVQRIFQEMNKEQHTVENNRMDESGNPLQIRSFKLIGHMKSLPGIHPFESSRGKWYIDFFNEKGKSGV